MYFIFTVTLRTGLGTTTVTVTLRFQRILERVATSTEAAAALKALIVKGSHMILTATTPTLTTPTATDIATGSGSKVMTVTTEADTTVMTMN